MKIKNIIFCLGFLSYLSIAGEVVLNAQGEDQGYLIIFVDDKNDIPPERALRKAYFQLLLDYNNIVINGFKDVLELLYGKDFKFYNNQNKIDTEFVKDEFNNLTEIIADDGTFIISQDDYSREELYEYMLLSERLTELFNELLE